MSAYASTSSLQVSAVTAAEDEEFVYFRASMRLPLAPVWGSTGQSLPEHGSGGMEGVREILAGWLMRYLPPLQSVLLTFNPVPTLLHSAQEFPSSASPFPKPNHHHDPTRLLLSPAPEDPSDDEAETVLEGAPVKQMEFKAIPLIEGSGFGLALIEFDGLGWRPRVGQKLVGSPTLSTPSHISLLLHNLFNASIPASHIPEDTWHFDPDFPVPAAIQERQNLKWPVAPVVVPEPDVEPEATQESVEGEEPVEGEELLEVAKDEAEEEVKEEEMVVEDEEDLYRERGWWRHNTTNEPLGGEDGRIEFTVIGLTIANSMISLTGSLLPAPFSSEALSTPHALSLQNKSALTKKRSRAHSVDSDLEGAAGDSDAGSVNFNEEAEEETRERSEAPPALAVVPKVKKAAKKIKGAEAKGKGVEAKVKKEKTPKVDSPAKKGTPAKAKKSKKE